MRLSIDETIDTGFNRRERTSVPYQLNVAILLEAFHDVRKVCMVTLQLASSGIHGRQEIARANLTAPAEDGGTAAW